MAKNIREHGEDNFVPIKRGRGRPKGSVKAKMEVVSETVGEEVQESFLPEGDSAPETAAPSFGHNQLDEGSFLRWVQNLNKHDEKGAELKLALKAWRTERKLLRKEANGAGIALGVLDEALEDLKTEQVDIAEREERRRNYHLWLGIPFETQADLMPTASLDPEREAKRAFKMGDTDGRLGKVRQAPAGVAPENLPHYLAGHDAGTQVLLKASPLTAGAFDADGALKPAGASPKPQADVPEGTLVFTEEHFEAGTDLLEANLKTLLGGHHEAFHNAETVIAVFGDKRRVLREPNDDGTYYVDTGEPEAEITDPEPVQPTANEFA